MQPECAFSQAIAGAVHGGDPAPKDTVRSYNICFPADFELRTCSIPPAPKILLDELGECDVLAVQIEESKYRASGDECFKIFRTYTVMNWCAYSEECGSREDQVFVVNRDAPDFDGVLGEGVCVLVRDADKNGYPEVYYSNDLVADPGELVAIPTPCKKNAHPLWRYTQVIKVYDVERPVVQQVAAGTFSMNSNTCKGNALVRFQLTDNCTGPIKLEKVELAKGKGGALTAPASIAPGWSWAKHVTSLGGGLYEVAINGLGTGEYELGILARDDCGNVSLQTRIPFAMVDNEAPVPVCHHGLSADLMPAEEGNGMVVVWASDLVASPVYDCHGQGPETQEGNPGQKLIRLYSIHRAGELADPEQQSLIFTCEDAGDSVLVELHAWDTLFNPRFCQTYVHIQDNQQICAPLAGVPVAGVIETPSGFPMGGVEVYANGENPSMAISDGKGKFRFAGLDKSYDYSITPFYDKDPAFGLNVRDLIMLQKHILGLEPFTNPVQWIAADVNRSGGVTVTDLALLQKVILRQKDHFPENTSWRFLVDGYVFSNPEQPLGELFPESVDLNNLITQDTSLHFVAIKTGDLDESALRPEFLDDRNRQYAARAFQWPDRLLRRGEMFQMPLALPEGLEGVEGLELELQVAPEKARILGAKPGLLSSDQYSVDYRQELLRIAAALPENRKFGKDPLLYIILEAQADIALSDLWRSSAREVPGMLYLANGAVQPWNLFSLRLPARKNLCYGCFLTHSRKKPALYLRWKQNKTRSFRSAMRREGWF
ncbi:MAG: hypothetical protein IPH16_17715 [Haliscomenobacter sp.]|nr:hypothetical protein [Haliscomenobacter sp.]